MVANIKTKLMVGIFVIMGFTIATAAIIWLGMSSYFDKGLRYVAYFDESVQGLDKDSPVKYRGVPIGRVESIKVAPDATLIEVVMKIEEGLKPEEHRGDVVAQLKSIGITGIMFVEIERKKANEPDLAPLINFSAKYPIVATKPSGIKKLLQGIDDVVSQFKGLNFGGISSKLEATLDNTNQAVIDLQAKRLSSDMRSTFDSINKTMDSVEKTSASFSSLVDNTSRTVSSVYSVIDGNKKEIAEAISGLRRSMKNADRLLANGAALVKDTENGLYSFQQQLNTSLQNLENATGELDNLLKRVSDHPSQLIFGEPPPARSLEPDVSD